MFEECLPSGCRFMLATSQVAPSKFHVDSPRLPSFMKDHDLIDCESGSQPISCEPPKIALPPEAMETSRCKKVFMEFQRAETCMVMSPALPDHWPTKGSNAAASLARPSAEFAAVFTAG